jgi:hypothetical protein
MDHNFEPFSSIRPGLEDDEQGMFFLDIEHGVSPEFLAGLEHERQH